MTKTLRIISIIAAIAVVLGVSLPAAFSSGQDENKAKILSKPGIIESFKNLQKPTKSNDKSPLVVQAEKYALILNPPKPKPRPKPKSRPKNVTAKTSTKAPPKSTVGKFELIATSYFPSKPELSLALVHEAGSGYKWIRQANSFGHVVFKEILDGKVVIKDGSRTYDIIPKRMPKKSLVKGETPAAISTLRKSSNAPIKSFPAAPVVKRNMVRQRPEKGAQEEPVVTPPQDPRIANLFDKFVKDIEGIENREAIDKGADELIKALKQISDEEAGLLDELGKKLEENDK